MKKVYVGFGSNLNDKKKNLELALKELSKVIKVNKVSSLYESEPWGYKKQDNFYNAVIELETDLEPLKLLALLKGIEVKIGRKRTKRWRPRVVDLDILLYGSEIVDLPRLKIPHTRLRNRIFVLLPLLELASELVDPINQKKFSDYLDDLNSESKPLKIASFNYKSFCWDEIIQNG